MSAAADPVIQWFPGHMAQALRRVGALMRAIDVVIEVVDARLPETSANPALAILAQRKVRLRVLSHDDLADPATTRRWVDHYTGQGLASIAVVAKEKHGARAVAARLAAIAPPKPRIRAVIVGAPNTGKSALLNGLIGRSAAKVADKAGVTRMPQWFKVRGNLELLDTPGMMMPKIATPQAQWMLALTGAIPRERFDPEDVVERFAAWLRARDQATQGPDFDAFVAARGFLRAGGEADRHNAALAYLREFNDGTFGRISLEAPPVAAAAAR